MLDPQRADQTVCAFSCPELRAMIRETFPVGPISCNCSILGDELSRQAIVVDPGDDIPHIIALLAKHHLTVKQIVVTHAHIDHIAGAHRLKTLTEAPISYNQNDLPLVAMMGVQAAWFGMETPEVHAPDIDLTGASTVAVEGLAATVYHTPGHTPGSICLHLPDHNLLLAGDTLFAGSIGRTDLPGGNAKQLIHSIHTHLMPLPQATVVIPGHGPATSIGAERESNPFLKP